MTKLNYLKDTYLFDSSSEILETIEDDKGMAVILDQTIFYPQGGGQPADSGMICSENAEFKVIDVRLNVDGVVHHYGEFKNGSFQNGDVAKLSVEKEKRILHAKLHSAGHLLDCAVDELGLDGLVPTKGFHFPAGPYVEYEGIIENGADLIPALEKKINELVDSDLIVEDKSLTSAEAEEQGVWAPEGKSARVVNFHGFPYCGCGGTHVNSAKEIGSVIVRKIKSKKGKTRIAYALG